MIRYTIRHSPGIFTLSKIPKTPRLRRTKPCHFACRRHSYSNAHICPCRLFSDHHSRSGRLVFGRCRSGLRVSPRKSVPPWSLFWHEPCLPWRDHWLGCRHVGRARRANCLLRHFGRLSGLPRLPHRLRGLKARLHRAHNAPRDQGWDAASGRESKGLCGEYRLVFGLCLHARNTRIRGSP